MSSVPKVGVFTVFTDRTPVPITDLAVALEERGFESLWVGEHTHIPVEGSIFPEPLAVAAVARVGDPFVLLTAAAAVTSKLRLGTAICLAAEYEPIGLAHLLATLDMVSEGRVELGVGYGANTPEMRNRALDIPNRRKIIREKILAMKEIWGNDVASFDGEFVSFSESWSWPKPVQRPHPPVLLGARGPQCFEHVVEFCDAWLPNNAVGGVNDEELKALLDQLRETAERAGRDPATIKVTMMVPPTSRPSAELLRSDGGSEPAQGQARVAPLGMGLTLEMLREGGITRDDVEHYASLGIDRINIAVGFPNVDSVEPMLDHLAEQVLA